MAIFSIRLYHYNNMLLLSRKNLFCEKKYLNVLKSHEVGQNVMLLNSEGVHAEFTSESLQGVV